MGVATRRIVVEGSRHTIMLTGKVEKDHKNAVFRLFVNGVLHDETSFNIQMLEYNKYFKNYAWMLNAKLDDDIGVGVKFKSGIFRRPLYTVYVGDQIVHQEKGTWGLI